jgi:signal transduction histidine kinase
LVSDSFGALVQQCISIQREINGHRIEYRVSISPGLKAVCVDSGSLQEVLHTLTQNATDAISDRGVIEVIAREGDAGDHMELVVQDSGCGISPSLMGKIFEPFYSTKSMDDRNGVSVSGRGLGLWGIYSLLKSYGGTIECQSEVGKGSRFSVKIPHSRAIACPLNLPIDTAQE